MLLYIIDELQTGERERESSVDKETPRHYLRVDSAAVLVAVLLKILLRQIIKNYP